METKSERHLPVWEIMEPPDLYSFRRRPPGNCHEIPASILERYRKVTVLAVADAASLLPVS